jgi:acetyl esterase/lipase
MGPFGGGAAAALASVASGFLGDAWDLINNWRARWSCDEDTVRFGLRFACAGRRECADARVGAIGGAYAMPIWPWAAPDLQPAAGPEHAGMATEPIAGKLGQFVENVSRPTMTVYSPTGENTGAAVVVFPGGGYQELAIDLEGTEVCDWLTPKGITCVLLKYRVPNTGEHWDEKCNCELKPKAPMALEDAQRTVRLVRLHAAEWHIDPHRIGVLGFSAGGHLVADISTHFDRRLYPPVDAADKESGRPDFAVALYPGHLWIDEKKFALNPNITVTKNAAYVFGASGERQRGQH